MFPVLSAAANYMDAETRQPVIKISENVSKLKQNSFPPERIQSSA